MSTDQETLADILQTARHWNHPTQTERETLLRDADAILASDWLAERDAETEKRGAVKALRDFAADLPIDPDQGHEPGCDVVPPGHCLPCLYGELHDRAAAIEEGVGDE